MGTIRELSSHKGSFLNNRITVVVVDSPSEGNMSHHYRVSLDALPVTDVIFAKGVETATGLTDEVLLAIVEDRLLGNYQVHTARRSIDQALKHVQEAMMWLHQERKAAALRNLANPVGEIPNV